MLVLRHLGKLEAAARVENALLVTLEEGEVRTGEVVGSDSGKACTTTAFTDAIIGNLGRVPRAVATRTYRPLRIASVPADPATVRPRSHVCHQPPRLRRDGRFWRPG